MVLAVLAQAAPSQLPRIIRPKIDKLSILGVRSFDNTRSETIQFHTPLTLIVGYNGSGKTTIIECLKYATTGDLPPNSKGGAFIHDPKLCGEKEVLAQVKLAFKATSGAKMVATRSLQLTVKKTTRQQKTLEGQLVMVKDGERTAISSRVAELDQIMPQYLGVSKAILDSVIFCHQDESLWPMSEPSVLKRKFDEIFEAMKYTKAIDNIKALRKKQNEELAKFKIMEQHSKEDKDKADRAEKRSIKLQEEIEALREETHQISQEMRNAAELADKAWKESESYAQVIGTLEGKRIEARSVQSTIDNLKRHLVEIDESDEWLHSTLEHFESKQLEYQQQEDAQKERYMDIKEQIESTRDQLGLKQAEVGKNENDKDQFERQIGRRENMIKEFARENNIRGFDDSLDEFKIDEFMQRMQRMVKEHTQALERVRKEGQSEVRETQNILNQIAQRKSAFQEAKNVARRQISDNDREAASVQARLNEIDVDEGTVAVLESQKEEVQSRLEKLKQASRGATWDKDLQDANTELRSLEDESTKLNQELIAGTKKAGDLARFAHIKKELKDRERQLETMSGAHGDRLSQLVSEQWSPENLELEYQNVVADVSNSMALAERSRDGIGRELDQVEFKLKECRTALEQRKKERDLCVKKIRDAIDDDPTEYPDILQTRQNHMDQTRKDVEQFAGMHEYFNMCLEALDQKKMCRTCMRPFKNETEMRTFKNRLEGLIKKNFSSSDEDLKQAEEEYESARMVNADYDTWLRLTETAIPELEKNQEQYQGQKEEILKKLESHDTTVDERAEKKREIESLSRTVTSIVRIDNEIKSLRSQIEEVSSKQQQADSSRVLEDIQNDIAAIGEKSRAIKLTISKLSSEKDQSRDDLNKAELALRDVQSSLANASHQLEKKTGLLARVEEYKKSNVKQRESIEKADRDIDELEPEIAKAQTKLDDISRRAESKERELQQALTHLSDRVHQLNLANDEIKSYVDRGGPEQLNKSRKELDNIQQEIRKLEEQQGEITREINKISAQLKDSDNTRRQYSDNLSYRQSCRLLEEVQDEIRQLEEQNAEIDRSRFKEESERWTRKHNALAAQQASKMGEMKSKDDQLLQLLADWNTDYKDAAANYKEAHIKVETTKAAVDDLGRYGGALDKAIMKYHSLKMEEINHIVEELWQRTYRGTDVDTILIRSDNENAKGNRSYNYRVCMVKQGAEMDMRGRCSAGQKVLASIIIRLALAECFGVNCGLIALDEPTTNLDRDNIRSLAESLHDIIKTRQQQANFQLIVITHDEEFLHHMQCADFSDYYYRVSRNERQKSIIERQSIAENKAMDQAHARALEALQPFIHLTTSSTASSPRFVANIISNATSNPNTYVFAELLETPAVQALGSTDTPEEFRGYLKLLEIFAWGTWQEYQETPGLPALNDEQALKLRLLSLLTLSSTIRPLTYQALMQALSIPSAAKLESLVTTAIYSSLIVARLSPATNPPTVNVTAVAPLRDVRPQTVSTLISILSEWEGRCGDIINGIEAEIAKIKDQTIRNGVTDRQRTEALEKAVIAAADADGDDTVAGFRGVGRNSKHGLRSGRGGGVRPSSSSAAAAAAGGSGSGSGSNSNKREYSGDDLEDEDNGYFDNGSDGGLDVYGGSRMEIDEGAGAGASAGRGGGASRQSKRLLGVGRKT
ncbi:uncharacterized protein BHQ10_001863 [Talaromyces amestolkiae]|uniref:DNA repair protein RAD50 n=1 Tax=Talaromyces amestolkiae TaxID=1196081 RepID=A0A364KQQ9_TALAM|nr:uncharacterized protein BHQ10_001863 [Talaromyces amestolkiae]RAO65851.1 hypothetical protein BHQ10_001863 [Talaromyces amestolkiae]